jgi:hypothetical protein
MREDVMADPFVALFRESAPDPAAMRGFVDQG